MNDIQISVHRRLMQELPVRTVRCDDYDWDVEEQLPPEPMRRIGRAPTKVQVNSGYLSPIQRTEIGERRMLNLMRRGETYSAKHLAAMAGMNDKAFYTHVKRMVKRGQLVRSGTSRHFRYSKPPGGR